MPMARAPEGMIIMLVEEMSPGTRMNSTLMSTSGATATFMWWR